MKKCRKKRQIPVPLASSRLRRQSRRPPEPAGSQRYGATGHFFTGSEERLPWHSSRLRPGCLAGVKKPWIQMQVSSATGLWPVTHKTIPQ